MTTNYTYHVKAFAPDPRTADGYFTYDGTVDRDAALSNNQEYESLAKGLSDHVFVKTGVKVSPASFAFEKVELLGKH